MIYEKLASYYDMFIDEELLDKYISWIEHYHKEGSVIDLGTGTAPLAIELAKKGYHVTATDISTEMLEVAYNNSIVEDVKINFFLHNILDTVNKDYDVICMSSDVINYLANKQEVDKALHNVSLAMNKKSIFIFDSLRPTYFTKVSGHAEEILLADDVMRWNVTKTNVDNQIKHTVKIGNHTETHLQMSYTLKEMQDLLHKNKFDIVKKHKYDERILFVCKKR